MLSHESQDGFTLVELMVVVLIVGILVSVAIPIFNAARANAWEKSCYTNQRTIEGSCQTYNAYYGALPSTVSTMVPIFVKVSPVCPKTGAGYHLDGSATVDGDSGEGAAGWSSMNGTAHTHF